MKSSEYYSQCPFNKDCDAVLCSPWGFTHTESPDVNGKTLLIVGLNDNDPEQNIEKSPSRMEYSDYLKGLMKEEIRNNKLKCLSNLMPPITRFLLQSDTIESRLSALEHLNWCNMISCCPPRTPRSKPTTKMRDYCEKRLKEDQNHELINRIILIRPTHILVVHGVARKLWTDSNQPGAKLYETLRQMPAPAISFSKHPSQTTIKRQAYWDEVYGKLSGKERENVIVTSVEHNQANR